MLVALFLALPCGKRMFPLLQHLQGVGMGETGRGDGICRVSHPMAFLLAHQIATSIAWWL